MAVVVVAETFFDGSRNGATFSCGVSDLCSPDHWSQDLAYEKPLPHAFRIFVYYCVVTGIDS